MGSELEQGRLTEIGAVIQVILQLHISQIVRSLLHAHLQTD